MERQIDGLSSASEPLDQNPNDNLSHNFEMIHMTDVWHGIAKLSLTVNNLETLSEMADPSSGLSSTSWRHLESSAVLWLFSPFRTSTALLFDLAARYLGSPLPSAAFFSLFGFLGFSSRMVKVFHLIWQDQHIISNLLLIQVMLLFNPPRPSFIFH